jgi:hypothetical protein
VAALAQNGDGLRADQAGAPDDDDLHGFTSLVDDRRPKMGSNAPPRMGRSELLEPCRYQIALFLF